MDIKPETSLTVQPEIKLELQIGSDNSATAIERSLKRLELYLSPELPGIVQRILRDSGLSLAQSQRAPLFSSSDIICDQLPNFRVLDLSEGFTKNFSSIARAQNLRYLDLANSKHLTDEALEQIGALSHIEVLNLTRCSQITARGLQSLSNLQSLHTLVTAFSGAATGEGLRALQNFPKLKILITGGDNVAGQLKKDPMTIEHFVQLVNEINLLALGVIDCKSFAENYGMMNQADLRDFQTFAFTQQSWRNHHVFCAYGKKQLPRQDRLSLSFLRIYNSFLNSINPECDKFFNNIVSPKNQQTLAAHLNNTCNAPFDRWTLCYFQYKSEYGLYEALPDEGSVSNSDQFNRLSFYTNSELNREIQELTGRADGVAISRFASESFNTDVQPELRLLDLSNRIGGSVELIASAKRLAYLDLTNCIDVDDSALGQLANLKELEFLNLTRCSCISAEGLSALAQLPKLKALVTVASGVAIGEDIAPLRQLTNLKLLIAGEYPYDPSAEAVAQQMKNLVVDTDLHYLGYIDSKRNFDAKFIPVRESTRLKNIIVIDKKMMEADKALLIATSPTSEFDQNAKLLTKLAVSCAKAQTDESTLVSTCKVEHLSDLDQEIAGKVNRSFGSWKAGLIKTSEVDFDRAFHDSTRKYYQF